jgi:hypothetical protein
MNPKLESLLEKHPETQAITLKRFFTPDCGILFNHRVDVESFCHRPGRLTREELSLNTIRAQDYCSQWAISEVDLPTHIPLTS